MKTGDTKCFGCHQGYLNCYQICPNSPINHEQSMVGVATLQRVESNEIDIDEEVVMEALRNCTSMPTSTTCLTCPYTCRNNFVTAGDIYCKDALLKRLLVLIDHKNAEIDRLQRHNLELAKKHYNDGAENFAEKIKKFAYKSTDWSRGIHPMVVEVEDIDDVLAEMQKGL